MGQRRSIRNPPGSKPGDSAQLCVERVDKGHTRLVYCEQERGVKMPNVTVNISFQDALLAEIDAEAKRESRTRSELLREAARLYVRRQKEWERVFALGDKLTKRRSLTATDVVREIRSIRRRKNP